MTIQRTAPIPAEPSKGHSAIVGFTLTVLPSGWDVVPSLAERTQPAVSMVLADGIKNGPGSFTAHSLRELALSPAEAAALTAAQEQKIRVLRRAIEDVLAAGIIPGASSTD